MEVNKCSYCNKEFRIRKNLYRHEKIHLKTQHFFCELCNYSTPRIDSFKKHQSVHGKLSRLKSCALCSFKCNLREAMITHLETAHEIRIEKENLKFETETQFNDWKLEEEKNTVTFYTSISGRRERPKDKCLILSFKCFRDGFFKSAANKKRKTRGSNKINGFCPARMDATISPSGKVEVKFIKTHVGHENELIRLRLSKAEKKEIIEKLESNVSFKDILEPIKNATPNDKLERIHLLNRKDLSNISRMPKRLSEIREKHAISLELSTENIIAEEGNWKYLTENPEESHILKKIKKYCNCDIRCTECDKCSHVYTCTCPDGKKMCEHVHCLIKYLANVEAEEAKIQVKMDVNENESLSDDGFADNQEQEHFQNNTSNSDDENNLELRKVREEALDDFNKILNSANSIKDLAIIKKMIHSMKLLLESRNAVNPPRLIPFKRPKIDTQNANLPPLIPFKKPAIEVKNKIVLPPPLIPFKKPETESDIKKDLSSLISFKKPEEKLKEVQKTKVFPKLIAIQKPKVEVQAANNLPPLILFKKTDIEVQNINDVPISVPIMVPAKKTKIKPRKINILKRTKKVNQKKVNSNSNSQGEKD